MKTEEMSLEDIKKFRESYQTAIDNNELSFIFNNHKILVVYAKYLLEYIDSIGN